MSRLERPQIEGIEFPELPLPWEWGKRMDIASGLGMTALRSGFMTEETRPQLREYVSEIQNRFLVPGAASAALRETLTWDDTPLSGKLVTTATEGTYTEMMQRFEQNFLGLEPVNSTDGIRWWVSNAGGSGGVYPAEAIANLYDMSSQDLIGYIHQNKSPIGWINARADKYLIPVKDNPLDTDTVIIDGARELTEEGKSFVDYILMSYERGLSDGLASSQSKLI